MTRRLIVTILRLALRVYFRRVEVAGVENVPRSSPAIFVLNHPNALVDPAFLLCLAPRRVSFLAKAPLFSTPVLKFFVRALDSLPVSSGEVRDLKIIPAGLYYTSKTAFRSSALLYFGKPIEVTRVEVDAAGNPPRDAVRDLSQRIERALGEVVLEAEHEEALQTITRAEKIFSSPAEEEDQDSLAEELQLQQRFVRAYAILRQRAPQRLHRLEVRLSRFEEELRQAGFDPDDLSPPVSTLAVVSHLITRCCLFILLLGPAVLGTTIHYPAYRLGEYFSTRFSQDSEDVVSTIKIISALLLFPVTWIAAAFTAYERLGWLAALFALLLLPGSGYVAIRFFEELDKFLGGLRALAFFLTRRRFFVRLLAERNAIRGEILALGDEAATATQ